MGEAANSQAKLPAWTWHDRAAAALAVGAGVPQLILAGWQADAGRRVLFVPVLMGAGIGAYFALGYEPTLVAALTGFLGVAAWLLASRSAGPGVLVALIGAIAATSAGFALAVTRAQMNEVTTLARETRPLAITGRIVWLEPADRGRTRVKLQVHRTIPVLDATPERVRLSIGKTGMQLQPGDWIEVRATLRPLPAPVAPGSYDFGRKLWFDGIGAVGFSFSPVKKVPAPREATPSEAFAEEVQKLRRAVSARILAAMSERTGPIAAAFLTGERGLISDEDNEAMRDSSLAHLLSISGLHMALAGFGFFMALRLIFAAVPAVVLNAPVKKWAAAAAIVASFAYLLLSGASVPTQRAFVMIVVALVAILFDRSALTMRSVAIAAIVILVLSPESWIDPSFQMSFAAVVALIAAYEWWNARRIPDVEPPGPVRRLWLMLAAAAATSLIAGLATAPFAAYHFNRFADYGVAANVMAMPVVSFIIMPAGVLALILMPFGLEDAPLAVMEAGLEVMLSIAHWVASWPGAAQAVAAWPLVGLVLIVAGGLWLAIWLSPWRWLGFVPVVAGLALLPFAAAPDILIASDGDNVAVRDANGTLHLLSSRRGRFDAEIWLRRDGDQREVKEAAGAAFACDAAGCLAPIRGSRHMVLVAFNGEAIAEDCTRATVVVDLTRGWHPACASPTLVVTRRLLEEEGAIAAKLTGGVITWTSAAKERGDRPWANRR